MAEKSAESKNSFEKGNSLSGITTPKVKSSADSKNNYAGRGFQQTNG